jgi:hypothetical protein
LRRGEGLGKSDGEQGEADVEGDVFIGEETVVFRKQLVAFRKGCGVNHEMRFSTLGERSSTT